MALTRENQLNSNKKVLDNQDNLLKNSEKSNNLSLDIILNWCPKDYYLTLEELKTSEGYKPIVMDELHHESCTDLLLQQIEARDNVIFKLYQYFENILNISEQSQIHLKEMNKKKTKLLRIIRQLKRGKSSKKLEKKDTISCEDKNIQTEVEAPNSYDWNLYYSQYYGQYYGCNSNYVNFEMNNEDSTMVSKAVTSSDSLISDTIQNSSTIPHDKNVAEMDSSKDINCKADNEDFNWNKVDVKEEVRELATEITQKLGFVFIDELDMYFDHSSGYYYDQKTSLYYDGNTGTYFYYNYETNKYEFYAYAQVNPAPPVEGNSEAYAIEPYKQLFMKEKVECPDTEESVEKEIKEQDKYIEDGDDNIDDNIEIAPSLRLMVKSGESKGMLHMITVDGGIIGREGDLSVLLNNPSISKMHAEITYRSEGPIDHHFYLQDLGSVNGTFIRGQRLSDSKQISPIVEIGHGWEIKLGDVLLCCHIHPGLLTCNECEPGLVAYSSDEDETSESSCIEVTQGQLEKEKERRRQNKVIRKKFSINYFDPGPASKNPKYKDRAEERREVVGSDNPYEKTEVASIDTNLTRENKGFQLMEKMGWTEGQSLGVKDTGLTEPVVPVYSSGRVGIGCPSYSTDVNIDVSSSRKIKQRIMENSKLMELSQSELPSENSEQSKSVQPIQFIPSSGNSNGT